jgi:hypothetical protein
MDDLFDDPFENPMYCGRLGDLSVYLSGDPQDPELLWCDLTGFDQTHLPGTLIGEVIETELKRHIRRAHPAEQDEEEQTE